MNRYLKLIITLLFLLTINNLIQSQVVSDSVFCYLMKKEKQNIENAISLSLFIHNACKDSIFISDFNKYISNVSAVDFRKTQERIFYWDLQTLSNTEPDNIVTVSVFAPTIKTPKRQNEEQNVNIVLPPNSTFISDVYMLDSPFVVYPLGYYNLCLYYKMTRKCIAKTIIELK